MKRLLKKLNKAASLFLQNRPRFWSTLKPYFFKPEEPCSGVRRINGVNFEFDLDLDPGMRPMFLGQYERNLTDLLERLLRPGDTFIDVGSNVGYISAFALGLVGKRGSVHSFEPVPQYFQRLQRLQKLNPGYHLHVNPVAVGSQKGTAQIAVTNLKNIGWNTMVPGFMPPETVRETLAVPVIPLDEYLASNAISGVRVVKIDTEGYEFPVMQGFENYLKETQNPPVIIIEIAVGAFPLLQTSLQVFSSFMSNLDYVPRSMDLTEVVSLEQLDKTTDVVFVPRSLEKKIIAGVRGC